MGTDKHLLQKAAHDALQDKTFSRWWNSELPDGAAPLLTIEEGGVRVDLAFPDTDCIRRFQRRVGRVPLPPEPPER